LSITHDFENRKRLLIKKHAHSDNLTGLFNVLTTLLPIAAIWYAIATLNPLSIGFTILLVMLMSLWTLRSFVLMHECGHGSLFRSQRLNQVFGFVFGVVTGRPQFVWSQHHKFHHATNGNWSQYQGPLDIITTDKYRSLSTKEKSRYRHLRSIWMATHAGGFYLILGPRLILIRDSLRCLAHMIRRLYANPSLSLKAAAADFKTGYWTSSHEYWDMFATTVVLLILWTIMCALIGPMLFFTCYIVAVSLAGAGALLIFTVQHNFEHAYASGDENWSYNEAALYGTSFLQLPGWLNWFTANIAYHHIHHLSARIPAYRLIACHEENSALFEDVKRIRLAEIPQSLKFILWDTASRRLVSVAEFEKNLSTSSPSH
jgi:omega-6 fatty acid desaturase (delta-12 desaturase)